MSRILVTEAVTGHAMDRLREEADLDVVFEPDIWKDATALAEAVKDAEAIIVRNQTQVTAELIAAAPKLKIVARAGAGLPKAYEAGLRLCLRLILRVGVAGSTVTDCLALSSPFRKDGLHQSTIKRKL